MIYGCSFGIFQLFAVLLVVCMAEKDISANYSPILAVKLRKVQHKSETQTICFESKHVKLFQVSLELGEKLLSVCISVRVFQATMEPCNLLATKAIAGRHPLHPEKVHNLQKPLPSSWRMHIFPLPEGS